MSCTEENSQSQAKLRSERSQFLFSAAHAGGITKMAAGNN